MHVANMTVAASPYPFAAPQNLPFVPPYNYDTIQWLETFNG